MNGQNEENLKELFEKFLSAEQAKQALEDVRKGEQILREHPAPQPDGKLIADIKVKTARALLRRKASAFKRIAYKAAAVAAVFIILAVIGVKLFEKGGGEPRPYQVRGEPERIITASIIPKTIWESDDIADDDADLATLIAEIEQIESEALALQLDENDSNGNIAVTELEMELIEINSNFWKG